MVARYEKMTGTNPAVDDGKLEEMLHRAAVKRGMTLTQYLAEAIRQQLSREDETHFPEATRGEKEVQSAISARPRRTRDSIEIIRDILALGDVAKTRIKYEVGLDHKQAERYLEFMVKGGLVEKIEGPRRGAIFHPSKLGIQLLQRIDEIDGILENVRVHASR